MKRHAKIVCGTLLAVLVMATPLAAQARPGGPGGPRGGYAEGCGPGMRGGDWYQALTPEKQQAVSALFEAHRAKVEPIREQLWLKRTTLDALSSNPKVEPQELTALIGEIAKLRQQLFAERKAFAERMEKETGVKMPYTMAGGPGRLYRHDRNDGFGRGCAR